MKKLISTLTALTLTLSSMVALSSNATIYIYDSEQDSIPEGYSPIDADIASRYFSHLSSVEKYEKFYANEDATHLIASRQLSSIVVFDLADGVSIGDVQSVVWAYCRENETDLKYTAAKRVLTGFIETDYEYEIYTYGQGTLGEPEYSVKLDDAKKICKILKEKNLISGFKYVNRNQKMYFDAVYNEYPLTTHVLQSSDIKKYSISKDYVIENVVDCEVRVTDLESGSQLIQFIPPNENASIEEIMEFSANINEACGDHICGGTYMSPETLDISDSPNSSIDMYNAVLGDANCDGFVTIADSTLILQSLTNKDEYSLTAQGKYNADVYGNCDGISASDALEIQKLDAKVIDNFE